MKYKNAIKYVNHNGAINVSEGQIIMTVESWASNGAASYVMDASYSHGAAYGATALWETITAINSHCAANSNDKTTGYCYLRKITKSGTIYSFGGGVAILE